VNTGTSNAWLGRNERRVSESADLWTVLTFFRAVAVGGWGVTRGGQGSRVIIYTWGSQQFLQRIHTLNKSSVSQQSLSLSLLLCHFVPLQNGRQDRPKGQEMTRCLSCLSLSSYLCNVKLKGIVRLKSKSKIIESLSCVPNLYEFSFSVEHKRRHLAEWWWDFSSHTQPGLFCSPANVASGVTKLLGTLLTLPYRYF